MTLTMVLFTFFFSSFISYIVMVEFRHSFPTLKSCLRKSLKSFTGDGTCPITKFTMLSKINVARKLPSPTCHSLLAFFPFGENAQFFFFFG